VTEKNELLKLVIEVDDELIQEGAEPWQRPIWTYMKIAQRLHPGSSTTLENDPLFNAVNQIYSELYRSSDLHKPPMHIGAFMFRDVFFPIRIPLIVGTPAIKPVDFIDVPERQKEWLFNDQQSGFAFFDQVIDILDFVYGIDDINKTSKLPSKTVEWWFLAKQQLEAAAATVLGSFNKYAVIQNCCISTELLLKGALMAKGINEETLKSKKQGYGHNLENLVDKTAQQLPNLDQKTVLFAVKQLPDYVESRYEAKDFSRLALGSFLMNTQFIGGEIIRQFSDRNFRKDFNATPDDPWILTHRTFPKQIK